MPGPNSGGCIWKNEYSKTYPGITSAKNGKKDHCHCNHCEKDLSIRHKGRADIEKHVKTNEHIANCKKKAGTPTLIQMFSGRIFKLQFTHSFYLLFVETFVLFFSSFNVSLADTKSILENAAKEALWSYHKVCAIQSFSSLDCENQLFRDVYKQKNFHLGRTKCAAIISNVFAPKIVNEMKEELKTSNFVSIATDASNHVAVKMFPVIARWFSLDNGINAKILDLTKQTGLSKKMFQLY